MEDAIQLIESISRLSIVQQAVIALKYSGFTFEEISRILHITRNSASSNYKKAHILLQLDFKRQ